MNLQEIIKLVDESKIRVSKYSSLRNDDFGHDCQKLLEAESNALSEVTTKDIPELCKAIELLLADRKELIEALVLIEKDNTDEKAQMKRSWALSDFIHSVFKKSKERLGV